MARSDSSPASLRERPPGGQAERIFGSDKSAQRIVSPLSGNTGLALVFALTIACVPVFSYQEGLSRIPQYLAAIAAGMACIGLASGSRLPRIHPAMMAYVGFTMFFGLTLIWRPWGLDAYQTLLKVCLLSLACHMIIRSPRQLLLVFACYSVMASVTLLLNVEELKSIGDVGAAAFPSGRHMVLSDSEAKRFAGTLANANIAGLYGIMAILGALIVFFNVRQGVRWPVLLLGISSGTMIMFFTGSRKAMLGVLVISLALPWLGWQSVGTKRRGSGRIWLMAILLLVAVVLLPHLPHSERLFLLLGSEGIKADGSSEARLYMALRAMQLWWESPLWGQGFDAFRRLSGFDGYSHSTFTEVLCNGGFLGGLLIGMFYLLPIKDMATIIRSRLDAPERKFVISLLVFWGMFMLFSVFAVMFDSRDYMPICAAICGYLQEEHRRARESLHPARRRNRSCRRSVTAAKRTSNVFPVTNPADIGGVDK